MSYQGFPSEMGPGRTRPARRSGAQAKGRVILLVLKGRSPVGFKGKKKKGIGAPTAGGDSFDRLDQVSQQEGGKKLPILARCGGGHGGKQLPGRRMSTDSEKTNSSCC